jgi:hypothetical protein
LEAKSNWLVGIVGNGKGFDGNVANLEGGTGLENFYGNFVCFGLAADAVECAGVGINGDAVAFLENAETVDVVAMLVRDADAIDAFRYHSNLLKPQCHLLGTEPCINQNAGFLRGHIDGVPRTPAG